MQSANTSGFAKGGGKKRNIIVAVATLLAVALLAGAAWFGFQKFASAPLETTTYEGKGYSIVYPSEGWEKEEIGDEVTFSKDLDGNYKSSITVRTSYVGETSAAQEEEALNILLESMTKEELAKSMGEDVVVGEFESKIEDRNGRKEFIVRATLKEKKTADAIVTARAFVANEQINMALVGVYEKTDKALYNNVDVVIDSFTVK